MNRYQNIYSLVTQCGKIESDYVYHGCYAFNFSCGALQVYIYYSERFKEYYLYTRSFIPRDKKVFSVSAISDARGYLVFSHKEFKYVVHAYFLACFDALELLSQTSLDVPKVSQLTQINLFDILLESDSKSSTEALVERLKQLQE